MPLEKESQQLHLQLGPFQGITDVHYRMVFKDYFEGIDKFFTPFFTGIQKDNSRSLRTDEIDPKLNNVKVTVPQILSNDAEEIIRFSQQCKAMGYNEVNLNMGCPYPMVAKKKRGSGLMPYSELIGSMFDRLNGNLATDFSIKCRLGYNDPDEIDELLPLFNSFNLSELIVHARVGTQMYKGVSDVDRFASIIPAVKTKLVYNGDIFSTNSFQIVQQKLEGIQSWMLGRGILADPFLASDLKGISTSLTSEERKSIVYHFITALYIRRREVKGENPSILGRMKEIWSYMRWSFDEPLTLWRLIRKVNTFDTYDEAIEQIFSELTWKGSGYSIATPAREVD